MQHEDDFRAWVSANRDRLRRTAYLLCGDWHLSDDLVQDALARTFAVWPRIVAKGQPDAYVRKTVVNLFLDHRRRPARREQVRAELPDRAVETARANERVEAALASLPPGQRAVVVLRYWEDLSIEQTAQLLGRTNGHVKSQASRGLASLRAVLGDPDLTTTRDEAI